MRVIYIPRMKTEKKACSEEGVTYGHQMLAWSTGRERTMTAGTIGLWLLTECSKFSVVATPAGWGDVLTFP